MSRRHTAPSSSAEELLNTLGPVRPRPRRARHRRRLVRRVPHAGRLWPGIATGAFAVEIEQVCRRLGEALSRLAPDEKTDHWAAVPPGERGHD
ncbi:hypothetical protein [Actinacidiphila glaucinigra]|uniref:hypothetical protein n=1 Tax=Actinacidiphila glaucinigra TaxID=235986 RepID=UPI003723C05B